MGLNYALKFPDPRSTSDHVLHADDTRAANKVLHTVAQLELEKISFVERLKEIALEYRTDDMPTVVVPACVGSDGRHEKGVSSPLEMIVFLCKSALEKDSLGRVAQRLYEEVL